MTDTEADTCRKYVLPKLYGAGWTDDQINEQHTFTDGRHQDGLRSQIVTSNVLGGRGGRRYAPYVFTEQGVAMLSSVLRSDRAIDVNVEIMRTFVRLRQMLSSHAELARKLAALEKKYDSQFKIVFDAIRQMMSPSEIKPKRQIGFHVGKEAEP